MTFESIRATLYLLKQIFQHVRLSKVKNIQCTHIFFYSFINKCASILGILLPLFERGGDRTREGILMAILQGVECLPAFNTHKPVVNRLSFISVHQEKTYYLLVKKKRKALYEKLFLENKLWALPMSHMSDLLETCYTFITYTFDAKMLHKCTKNEDL